MCSLCIACPSKHLKGGPKTVSAIDKENKFGAHNYHPLPVVIEKAEGMKVAGYSWLGLVLCFVGSFVVTWSSTSLCAGNAAGTEPMFAK